MADLPKGDYSLDETYLSPREYREPKHAFAEVISAISRAGSHTSPDLLDVGCASGAFLYHALRQITVERAVGVDPFEPLLEQAREHVPEAEFLPISVFELAAELSAQFDVCTCLGTLALFDDLEGALENLLATLRPGGRCFVWDLINEEPVDLLMRYRRAGGDGDWNPAYNTFSVATWRRLTERIRPGASIEVFPFSLPQGIEKGADPMRAWTIPTRHDENQLVSGTGQMLLFKILRIDLPA